MTDDELRDLIADVLAKNKGPDKIGRKQKAVAAIIKAIDDEGGRCLPHEAMQLFERFKPAAW